MTHKTCSSCKLPPSPAPSPAPSPSPDPSPIDLCKISFADNIKLSISGSFENEAGLLEPFQIVDRLVKIKKIGNLVDIDLGVDSKDRRLKFFGILFVKEGRVGIQASSAVLGNAKFLSQKVNDGKKTALNIIFDDYVASGVTIPTNRLRMPREDILSTVSTGSLK